MKVVVPEPFDVGAIIPHTRVESRYYSKRSRGTYVLECDGMYARFFVEVPRGMNGYFQRAMRHKQYSKRGAEPVLMPSMVEDVQNRKRNDYQVKLLAPPGISEGDGFFIPDLVVPGLRIADCIGDSRSPKGFVMVSDYLSGSQEMFSPAYPSLTRAYRSHGDAEFMGRLRKSRHTHDGKTMPTVYTYKVNSMTDPQVFIENHVVLDDITSSEEMCWWDLDLSRGL